MGKHRHDLDAHTHRVELRPVWREISPEALKDDRGRLAGSPAWRSSRLVRLPTRAAALVRLRQLAAVGTNMRTLRHLLAESPFAITAGQADDAAVLRRIAELLERGVWSLFERAPLSPDDLGVAESRTTEELVEEPPLAPKEQPVEELTWIAIELIGDDDEPIVGERYRIELADGTTKEGRLDSKGRARIDHIDPGSCQVTFPDLDGEAWEPV